MKWFLAAGLLVTSVAATAQIEAAGPLETCTLPVLHGHEIATSIRADRRGGDDECERDGGDFEVTYIGFPVDAETAFQAAVDAWSCQLDVDVPIRIEARWEPLSPATLGSAGPLVIRNFDGAPSPEVWYPSALADQFAGVNLSADAADIEATFNSAFEDWNLDPTVPSPGRYDLYTVVLHEIAHGLGFIGALRVQDGRGVVGEEGNGPYAYDLQTQDERGISLLNSQVYPPGSPRLGEALTEPVLFRGRTSEAAGLAPIHLFAPSAWLPGGSYSHLDEATYPDGTPDGALSPFIARGEAVGLPGPATCAVLADLGWPLEGACADAVGRLGAPASGLDIAFRGPNPARTSTRIEVRSEVSRLVTVEIRDVRGRRVADLGTASLTEGRAFTVVVDTRALAAGVYLVVVRGGPVPEAVPLTVVRD